MTFSIGDPVTVTGGGSLGGLPPRMSAVVVAVVPPGEVPTRGWMAAHGVVGRYELRTGERPAARDEESYVVSWAAGRVVAWPQAARLRRVEAGGSLEGQR